MSLLTEAVTQEQQRIERMINQYEAELSHLPKGVLNQTVNFAGKVTDRRESGSP